MSNSSPQLDERTIKKYEELITENHQRQKEAGQEFDKQAVYIAGGGLALTLAVAKDFTAFVGKQYFVLLLLTWLFFGLTLYSTSFLTAPRLCSTLRKQIWLPSTTPATLPRFRRLRRK